MNEFFAALWSGLMIGSLYAIMAIGLTVIYGVSRVFNFAHGHVALIAGYLAWLVAFELGASYIPGILVALAVMVPLGWATYQWGVRPLMRRKEADFATLLLTLGLAIIVQFALLEIFGPRVKALPEFVGGNIHLWFGTIGLHEVVLVVISVALMAGIWAFMTKTALGRAMRGVASSVDGARIVGIDIHRVYGLTFALAFVLTGASGILLGTHSYMTPAIGWDWMIKGFIIVVFGGLGSIPGAILAAFTLGVIETMVTLYAGSLWIWPVWLAVFILVLTLRPQGILGGRAA